MPQYCYAQAKDETPEYLSVLLGWGQTGCLNAVRPRQDLPMPGDFGGGVSVSDLGWGVRIAKRTGTK